MEEMSKFWFKMGKVISLQIIDDYEVEQEIKQEEEDKEVERILAIGTETKRKLITGTCQTG